MSRAYGPRALRAWRRADERRTLRAVGDAIGRAAQTIANYESGASVPEERDRVLLGVLVGDQRLAHCNAWMTDAQVSRRVYEHDAAVRQVLAARAAMGG